MSATCFENCISAPDTDRRVCPKAMNAAAYKKLIRRPDWP